MGVLLGAEDQEGAGAEVWRPLVGATLKRAARAARAVTYALLRRIAQIFLVATWVLEWFGGAFEAALMLRKQIRVMLEGIVARIGGVGVVADRTQQCTLKVPHGLNDSPGLMLYAPRPRRSLDAAVVSPFLLPPAARSDSFSAAFGIRSVGSDASWLVTAASGAAATAGAIVRRSAK